jgi:cytochrome c oxidase assembly protein subunit 15
LALVCLQGAFGAWTVTHKLEPVIVTTHLLLGLTLLGGLGLFAARLGPAPSPDPAAARWQWAALVGLALLIVQIALGGWVSTNYAVLACTDFPMCNGHWIPPMDFGHGFHLWRALGKTGSGELLGQDALVAIHWTHRTFAAVVIAYLCWLWTRLARVPALRKLANALLAVLVLQFATGLSNIVLQWPLPVAVAHNGGAAVLLLILVMLNFQIASRRFRSHRARSAGA